MIRSLCSNLDKIGFLASKSQPVKNCLLLVNVFTILTTYLKCIKIIRYYLFFWCPGFGRNPTCLKCRYLYRLGFFFYMNCGVYDTNVGDNETLTDSDPQSIFGDCSNNLSKIMYYLHEVTTFGTLFLAKLRMRVYLYFWFENGTISTWRENNDFENLCII